MLAMAAARKQRLTACPYYLKYKMLILSNRATVHPLPMTFRSRGRLVKGSPPQEPKCPSQDSRQSPFFFMGGWGYLIGLDHLTWRLVWKTSMEDYDRNHSLGVRDSSEMLPSYERGPWEKRR